MNVDTNNGLGELPFQFSIKKQNVKYLRVPFLFVLLTSRQSLSYAPITSSRNLLRFRSEDLELQYKHCGTGIHRCNLHLCNHFLQCLKKRCCQFIIFCPNNNVHPFVIFQLNLSWLTGFKYLSLVASKPLMIHMVVC